MLKESIAVLSLSCAAAISLLGGTIYVNPNAAPGGDGSKEKPFASLAFLNEYFKRTPVKSQKEAVTVIFADGDYILRKPLVFGGETDAGSNRITTFKAENPGKARIVGGVIARPSDFQKVSDPEVLKLLPPRARGKVYECDLVKLGVDVKRYPEIFGDNGGLFELIHGGRRMTLSRYPNGDFMTIKKVLIPGDGQQKPGSWRDFYGSDKAKRKALEGPKQGALFEYGDSRHAAWVDAVKRGLWFRGYWRIPWQNEAMRVESIDPKNGTVKFAVPVGGGVGDKYRRPHGSGKERYFVFNLLEELDMPGEWCVDFVKHKLYFFPLYDLKKTETILADIPDSMITVKNSGNQLWEGLLLEGGRGDAFTIENGRKITVAGCLFRNIGNNAVKIKRGYYHTVKSCDMLQLGGGGVIASGGDFSKKISAGHVVENNLIHDFAEIVPVYSGAVNAGYRLPGPASCGISVRHNLIYNTPHVGILIDGGNHVVEYNRIHSFAEVSNDMGGIYSFIHPNRPSGNIVLKNNLIHDSHMGEGIYYDFTNRNNRSTGNILYHLRCGFLLKSADNCIMNDNIVVKCEAGVNSAWKADNGSSIKDNVFGENKTDFNLYPGKWSMPGNICGVRGDDIFVDPARGDFRLKPGSGLLKKRPELAKLDTAEKAGVFIDQYRKSAQKIDMSEIRKRKEEKKRLTAPQETLDRVE